MRTLQRFADAHRTAILWLAIADVLALIALDLLGLAHPHLRLVLELL